MYTSLLLFLPKKKDGIKKSNSVKKQFCCYLSALLPVISISFPNYFNDITFPSNTGNNDVDIGIFLSL